MAKQWFLETSAQPHVVVDAFNDVFFSRPGFGERMKFWSKGAQLRSNLAWEPTSAEGAEVAATLISGGLREAIAGSRHGGGSGIGTVVAMSVAASNGTTVAQFWLASFNTFAGINQQGDVLKSFTKQVAAKLNESGASATTHK